MRLLEPVERYFDAWNSHDGGAIAACFDADGGYTDPVSGRLSPPDVAAYAAALFSVFPDLRFELQVPAVTDPYVVAQWTMSGTQYGPLDGLPPTNAQIKLSGVDVLTVGEAGLLSVEGYFDQRSLLEQLGAQVTVQPANVGPLAFGTSSRFRTGSLGVPGAISVTWMDVASEEDAEEVKQRVRSILPELAQVPGFIGWVGISLAERLYTLTLWDGPEAVRQIRANAKHQAAVRRVFEADFGTALHTGVWVPQHLNPLWLRCSTCQRMIDADRPDEACSCGEPVPARRSFV